MEFVLFCCLCFVIQYISSLSDSKSQSSMLNHVSSSLLVNSLTSSSNYTSVVNSVSTNSIGNPSIPPAPLINNLILNNHVSGKSESNTSSTASATNNSSVITSLSVSSSTTTSQANMVNSNGDSGSGKGDVSLPMVMNGPTSAGGSFHQVRTLHSVAKITSDFARISSDLFVLSYCLSLFFCMLSMIKIVSVIFHHPSLIFSNNISEALFQPHFI